MQIDVTTAPSTDVDADWLLIGLGAGQDVPETLDAVLDGRLSDLLQSGEFDPTGKDVAVVHPRGAIPARRVLVAPLGKEITRDTVRTAAARGGRKAEQLGGGVLATTLTTAAVPEASAEQLAQTVLEGLIIGTYAFEAFKTSSSSEHAGDLEAVTLVAGEGDVDRIGQAAEIGDIIAEGTNLARTLVNEPANVATPSRLAREAQRIANAAEHISCAIIDREDAEELGMGAYLAVGQGSDNPPKFIVLEHRLEEYPEQQPVVLVGKAITFDSGGYNIKTNKGLWKMKDDMGGGAAVLGTFSALAEMQVPLPVVGIVPATENLISGHAYRPGDILTSLSGQTIEIHNTDAEGRLTLADALAYADRYTPRYVVDLATLTGSIVVALGYSVSGYFSSDDELADRLERAAGAAGEPVWRMPLWDEYDAYLESEVADMTNVARIRWGGAVFAALFLRKFTENGRWLHLDIAGTVFADVDRKPRPALTQLGATGVGVRTLVELLRAEAGA